MTDIAQAIQIVFSKPTGWLIIAGVVFVFVTEARKHRGWAALGTVFVAVMAIIAYHQVPSGMH